MPASTGASSRHGSGALPSSRLRSAACSGSTSIGRTRESQIRRSKTPAGWRDPSLNDACARALKELHSRARAVGFDDAEHYLFPWHGRDKKIDPSRPMTSWRSAWRSLRKAAGLAHVRFHDGRHTALTRLAEKGQPDWVIQAQMGHVSPAMMRTYSHIRRKALDEAAAALEPSFKLKFPRPKRKKIASHETCDRLMSQFTSRWDDLKKEVRENSKGFGSSGWTRTSNPPVNRLMQVHYLVDSSCL
jgi:Phage integrase family